MYEIAVISGKGGTGKTTLTLSMIPYFENLVIADCDVDAADLKVILNDKILEQKDFIGFQRPSIDYNKCIQCGLCYRSCKFDAISEDIKIKANSCEGCKVCEYVCPVDAISMHDYVIGKVFKRDTKYGPMVDARLIPGEESSGKLVSEVRSQAIQVAADANRNTILIDGSPGIACNVISTITGVDKVITVTEPTVSGLHDLKKVIKLIQIFNIETLVVINKYDLSMKQTDLIEKYCEENNIKVALKIPFDEEIVHAISKLKIPSLTDVAFFKSGEWKSFIKQLKE